MTCAVESEHVLLLGAELSEAILFLDNEELDAAINRILSELFADCDVRFLSGAVPENQDDAVFQSVTAESYFALSGKSGAYSESDFAKLNILTALTARLFSSRVKLNSKINNAVKSQLMHAQILDHLHESVITMDLAGFILSWNLGAERLFGYSASEAIGQNILFLYEADDVDVDVDLHRDTFLEYGGREMEVR